MAVTIKGLDKLLKDLTKFGDDGAKAVVTQLGNSKSNIERGAISRVPFEFIFIKQKINSEVEDRGLTVKVGVEGTDENPIPAYVEFGTGQFAKNLLFSGEYDQEIRDIAIKFKKDVDGRSPATPYLFPAFFEERPKLIERLEKELDQLARKV